MQKIVFGIDGFIGLEPHFIGSYGAVVSHYTRIEDELPTVEKLCPVDKDKDGAIQKLMDGGKIVIRDTLITAELQPDGVSYKRIPTTRKAVKIKEGILIFIATTARGNSVVVLKKK